MPNWCGNRLFVTGPRAEVAKFKAQAASPLEKKAKKSKKAKEEDTCLSFFRFVPLKPKKRLGDDAYIDFTIRQWGTKWDAFKPVLVTDTPNKLRYEFGTAWSPPVAWLKKVSRMYPILAFRMRYSGDYFGGVAEYKNGKGETNEWDVYS